MLTETDNKVTRVQLGDGPAVNFVSTPRGIAVSSLGLGALLGYTRPRNVHRVVKHLFGLDRLCLRDKREWFLVRVEVAQVLLHSYNEDKVIDQLWAYFAAVGPAEPAEPAAKGETAAPKSTGAEPAAKGETAAPKSTGADPTLPAVLPAVVTAVTPATSAESPLTAREHLHLGQMRVEQARFVSALIHARRLARELTPKEHRRLAHKAAEVALGEPIPLDEPPAIGTPIEAPSAAPIRPRPSLGAVMNSARKQPPAAAPRSAAPPQGDPFNFGVPPAPPVTVAPPANAKAWILSKFNPPNRATASELAYLFGFGCTKQKIGLEAGRLGFKEGHPWVETKQVQGRHSNREDCTIYYYNRDAALALIEAVLTYPTKLMRVKLGAASVPLDLFEAARLVDTSSEAVLC